jgi:uncharacterized protein YndB with AHSA1/START domain
MSQPSNEAVPADREIVTTRILEAPRELVWQVWTDPQHIAQWWGPTGFTTTTAAMDVRVGGQWRFTMHGPDGHDYKNLITFLELNAPSRLVYKHGGDQDLEPVNFTTTVTFDAMPGEPNRTRLTMRAVFSSAKAREFVIREYNAAEGGKQTIARLAGHVEALARGARSATAAGKPFVMGRVVKAPRDLVWRVWTQQEHLAKWFGPPGCTLAATSLDLRPGGVFHYCMRSPGAPDMWGKWVFREITPPERLVFVVSFADEKGNSIRAPWEARWPLEMLSIVTFEPHAGLAKGTVITLQWSAHNASAEEQRIFDDGHGSMSQGWTGTFDKLDEYVAKLK